MKLVNRVLVPLMLAFFFSTSHTQAQTCIQLLDSIEYFRGKQREKTIFYGETLLRKLDIGECNLDIGLVAVYNNLGLAFWDAKDQPNAIYAFSIALAYTPTDSLDLELLDVYYNLSGLHQELGQFAEADRYLKVADQIIEKQFGNKSLENVLHLFTKGVFYREIGRF